MENVNICYNFLCLESNYWRAILHLSPTPRHCGSATSGRGQVAGKPSSLPLATCSLPPAIPHHLPPHTHATCTHWQLPPADICLPYSPPPHACTPWYLPPMMPVALGTYPPYHLPPHRPQLLLPFLPI